MTPRAVTAPQAVVFGGGTRFVGSAVTPLLFYAAVAAEARGATIHRWEWQRPADDLAWTEGHRQAWIDPQVATALDAAGGSPLVIAKSLGSHAAAQVTARGLPAVWMTPMLRTPEIVTELERATAPFLLVGGTADTPHWDLATACRLTPHVLEIEGADHGMFVPGPLAASAAVLGRVATAVEHFLDTHIWPPAT